MKNSLKKVDEFMHISRRMRSIVLQSAVGGMVLSLAGMLFAAAGPTQVAGAVTQEIIDALDHPQRLASVFSAKSNSNLMTDESRQKCFF